MRRRLCPTFPRPERGASSVEYALLSALIAVVIIASVALFGTSTSNLFQSTCSSLSAAQGSTC